MIDINLLRKNPAYVEEALAKRNFHVDLKEFLALDAKRREKIQQLEKLKAEKNQTSASIPVLKKEGKDISTVIEKGRALGEEIKAQEADLQEVQNEQDTFLAGLPNLPYDDVQAGGKEANRVVESYGDQPNFSFPAKDHVTLAESLGLIDYKRGAKLAGNGFWIYTGKGAQLEWALLNYFVQTHLADGYEMLLPPHLLRYACGFTAGQFPKFEEDVFWLEDRADDWPEEELGTEAGAQGDAKGGAKGAAQKEAAKQEGATHGQNIRLANRQFLLPTAETALVNLYRDEILAESDLPKKFFAFTPCYRREAGSYRAEERGMIRGHQFNKVELFQYCLPDQGLAALDELVKKAVSLVTGLGLHCRLSALAAGDVSATMRKTLDIEVYIPSMQGYKEVSSASWAGDYQARRGMMRYRDGAGKVQFLHTLNASGLATSRIFPALLEQGQNEDGSVNIPEVLQAYMGGQTRLEPIAKGK